MVATYIKKTLKRLLRLYIIFFPIVSIAIEVPIYHFTMDAYSQDPSRYLPSHATDYSTPLLSAEYQASQLKRFYKYYYASDAEGLSPWSEVRVKSILPDVKEEEGGILKEFDNANQDALEMHYGENYKPHDSSWLKTIEHNMNLQHLDDLQYTPKNRAIAVNNTYARALPEAAPDFYHFSLAGKGFPFDNLQMSAIWSGTPLYVLSLSKDKAWSLVLTPDLYFAWVKSADIAYTSDQFIKQWQSAAEKSLIAITATETSILDQQSHFQLSGYIGAVFPKAPKTKEGLSIFIPVKSGSEQATIEIGFLDKQAGTQMPLLASKKNMTDIIKQLKHRPYGWGGSFFYNDCSQELKSIFTPFGIWLPRNSLQQTKFGHATLDLSADNMHDRLRILKEKGHPLMTIIYVEGHVMLYVGQMAINAQDSEALTYQNVWGLSPLNKDKRYVIGGSVFLPLLESYPQSPDINSQANKHHFKLVFLDELKE